MSGLTSYLAGAAAEIAVGDRYAAAGHEVLERRWRGKGGEIDLIVRDGATFVFVEVKRARDMATAASRVTARQMGRITRAATEYLGRQPAGQLSEARIDVALVDGTGAIEILENASMA